MYLKVEKLQTIFNRKPAFFRGNSPLPLHFQWDFEDIIVFQGEFPLSLHFQWHFQWDYYIDVLMVAGEQQRIACKSDGFCMTYDEFCMKNDEFCI